LFAALGSRPPGLMQAAVALTSICT
jgi:hypothetical protein